MANSNTPFGLHPLEYLSGAAYNDQARMYAIPSTDLNAYAIGDPVTLAGSADANGVATVVLMTPGSSFVGVVVGFGAKVYGGAGVDPSAPETIIIPATKARAYYVMVSDDPNIIYEAQEIGTGTTFLATEVGLNANLVAGTNNGYVSGWTINNATEATTSSLDVKLLGLVQRPGNGFGQYAKWRVLPNAHLYRGGVTGV